MKSHDPRHHETSNEVLSSAFVNNSLKENDFIW